MRYTDAFPAVTIRRSKPVKAREAYIAVFRLHNRPDVLIGAPTLEDLRSRWKALTGMDLDHEGVQRTVIAAWSGSDA